MELVRHPDHLEAQHRRLLERRIRTVSELVESGTPLVAVAALYRSTLRTRPSTLMPLARSVDHVTTRSLAPAERGVRPLEVERTAWAMQNAVRLDALGLLLIARVQQLEQQDPQLARGQALRDARRYARNRAAVIARDQIGTLTSTVFIARAGQFGVQRYQWWSRRDNRVRDLHVRLHGTIRRIDDPHPTEGHPGDAINCRCGRRPIWP